jgi:hypothetical protein
MAPQTRKGTTAEKNCCPNARPIVDGIFLDIEDCSALHKDNILPLQQVVNKNIQTIYLLYIDVK